MKHIIIPILLGIALLSCKQQEINIIPAPIQMIQEQGTFKLSKSTKIIVDKSDSAAIKVAKYFQEMLKAKGIELELSDVVNSSATSRDIYFTMTGVRDSLGSEGYELSVNGKDSVSPRKKQMIRSIGGHNGVTQTCFWPLQKT